MEIGVCKLLKIWGRCVLFGAILDVELRRLGAGADDRMNECRWVEEKVACEENVGDGSKELDYCQGIVLNAYHSNETILSGVDGRGWQDFGSLVRRIGADRTVPRFDDTRKWNQRFENSA